MHLADEGMAVVIENGRNGVANPVPLGANTAIMRNTTTILEEGHVSRKRYRTH